MNQIAVLVPVYNYSVVSLVIDLVRACEQSKICFEIRVYDDGSSDEFKTINRAILGLSGVFYKELPYNIGRSKIRNLLASDAQASKLLFLDCDMKLQSHMYLTNFLICGNYEAQAISGGTIYEPTRPSDKNLWLHWYAGRHKESRRLSQRILHPYDQFTLNNLLISKDIFQSIRLDERIVGYGHEDTLFGLQLEKSGIPVCHIENAVIHMGLNRSVDFLAKSVESTKNLYTITLHYQDSQKVRLYRTFKFLDKIRALRVFQHTVGLCLPILAYLLTNVTPGWLFLLDLIKLHSFICTHFKHVSSSKNTHVRKNETFTYTGIGMPYRCKP